MKTKILFTALFFALAFCTVRETSAQSWAWAKAEGGTGDDDGRSVSTDAGGNVFVTGYFKSSAITFGTTTLIYAGGSDIFIVKYDASGTVLWATSAGGTGFDYGNSVSTDAGGNVFVTGSFKSPTITFGTTTLTNTDNTGNTEDMFIVKYDAAGTVLWAKSAGGIFWDDEGNSVSADAAGNVFVTGYFYSSAITFGTTTLIYAGGCDIFIVKYDASGTVLWATSAGGTSYDYGNSVSTDAGGNVFVTGSFESSPITFGTTTLTNANIGYYDFFIVKYDASGTVLWAKSAGGTFDDYGLSVSTDAGGNVFVTGFFQSSTITFGTTALTNANTGSSDIFIVKYDASGTVLWAKSAGGFSWDEGYSIAADGSGELYVTGYFTSPAITFGSTTLTNASAGDADIFIAKYDAGGNVLWAQRAGGTSDDIGNSIAADGSGNIYVTGSFSSSTITFGSTTLTNAGSYADIFIAKLNGITGISEFPAEENLISVYPNPFTASATLRVTGDKGQGTREFTMYDLLGRAVKQFKMQNSQCTITRDNLPGGMYFYKLADTEKNRITATGKIIIQ